TSQRGWSSDVCSSDLVNYHTRGVLRSGSKRICIALNIGIAVYSRHLRGDDIAVAFDAGLLCSLNCLFNLGVLVWCDQVGVLATGSFHGLFQRLVEVLAGLCGFNGSLGFYLGSGKVI